MPAPSSKPATAGDARIRYLRGASNDTTTHDSPRARDGSNQPAAEKATAAFVRRTLCAHQIQLNGEKGRGTPRPIHELLQPLTSSDDIDLELYAFIAIIVKDFVYTWYARITPDHAFVDELVKVIAHCTRQLDQRLRQVDWESLLLDQIPILLDNHITAFRTALEATQQSPLGADLHTAYRALQPHPALSPAPGVSGTASEEQQENEAIWRQLLARGILEVLLPPDDQENPCLNSLVAEILAELILGAAVCGRMCEPWMLWESIIRVCELVQPQESKPSRSADLDVADGSSRLEHYGLLSSREELLKPASIQGHARNSWPSIAELFWTAVQYTMVAFMAMRAVILALASASSLPPRASSGNAQTTGASPHSEQPAGSGARLTGQRALVSMACWRCISHFIELQERMPWLSGLLSLVHWASLSGLGKVGDTNSTLDRLLAAQIRSRLFDPIALPPLLRSLRAAIFPGNTLAPAKAAPTPEQVEDIRQRATQSVVSVLPERFCTVYFASSDRQDWEAAVAGWLDVVRDPYLNKHLMMRLVELLVVRVLPELAQRDAEA